MRASRSRLSLGLVVLGILLTGGPGQIPDLDRSRPTATGQRRPMGRHGAQRRRRPEFSRAERPASPPTTTSWRTRRSTRSPSTRKRRLHARRQRHSARSGHQRRQQRGQQHGQLPITLTALKRSPARFLAAVIVSPFRHRRPGAFTLTLGSASGSVINMNGVISGIGA